MVRGDDKLAEAVHNIHVQWSSGQISTEQASQRLEVLREANPDPVLSAIVPEVAAERFWTLPMALAWIIWRTNEKVKDYWEPYRETQREWAFDTFHNYRWPDPPAQLLSLVFPARLSSLPDFWDEADEQAALCTTEEAKAELWQRLQAGDLTATGVCQIEKRRVDIHPIEFIDLTLKYSFQLTGRRYPDVRNYDYPLVERRSVVRLWNQCLFDVAGTANLELKCFEMLMELMDREPRSPKPKIELRRDFQQLLGISGAAFNRAWAKADLEHGGKWGSKRRPRKNDSSRKLESQ